MTIVDLKALEGELENIGLTVDYWFDATTEYLGAADPNNEAFELEVTREGRVIKNGIGPEGLNDILRRFIQGER